MSKVKQIPPITKQEKDSLKNLIKKASKIILLGHNKPDPDCFASLAVSGYIIQQIFKKEVTAIADGKILDQYKKYLDQIGFDIANKSSLDIDFSDFDLIIVLDTSETRRTNQQYKDLSFLDFKSSAIIDHHRAVDESKNYDVQIIREHASCAEIVADIFEEEIQSLSQKIQPTIADIALFGIITDSKTFMISDTTQHTLNIASKLMDIGGNLYQIIKEYSEKSFKETSIFAALLSDMKKHELGFAYGFIYSTEFEDDDQRETVLDLFKFELQKFSDIDCSVVFQEKIKEKENYRYEIRFRSNKIDLLPLAYSLDGAGHHASAGGRVFAKNDDEALEKFVEKYKEYRKSIK